jgi:hypothetical protein
MALDIYKKTPIVMPSEEHILLDSLGGRLVSKALLDKSTNDLFGSSIDAAVANAVGAFRVLLDAKAADGRAAPAVRGLRGADGKKYNVLAGGKPEIAEPKFEVQKTDDGIAVSGTARSVPEAKRLLSKTLAKHGLDRDALDKHAQNVEEHAPTLTFNIEFGAEACRGILKMACNLLAHSRPDLFLGTAFDPTREDSYTTLHPVYSVLWLGDNLHEDTPFHSRYRVAEATKGRLFSDNLQIHTLELKKVAKLPASNQDADVDWGRFLTATDEERRVLADRSPIMKTAVDALTNLSLDPEAQRIAWERDRNERAARHMMGSAVKAAREEGHREGHEEGHKEGHEKGQRTGKVATLALLLKTKFGTLAEEHRHRIEAADEATLDRWCAAIFVAASVDDLLRQ